MNGYDEHELVYTLPNSLQTEISLYLHHRLIESVDLFNNCPVGFLNAIAVAMSSKICLANTLITCKGQPGDCMYFISSGTIELIDGGQVYAVLSDGSYVGEIVLLDGLYHVTARTSTYCELCVLDRASFDSIVQNYPEFIQIIRYQSEQTAKMEARKDKLKALFAE